MRFKTCTCIQRFETNYVFTLMYMFYQKHGLKRLCLTFISDDVVYNRTTKQILSGLSSAANALTDGNITSCISTSSTSLNSYIQIGNESLIVITGVYLVFGGELTMT